jgi:retron-type reverse transcriptase
MHHVTVDLLWQAYHWLKRSAAPGVDGVTWYDYGENLEAKLIDLHRRVHRGSYHPLPSRRKYIAKPDGRQRPLGIAALEDKIVQRAVVEVLNAILTSRTSWDSHTGSGLGVGNMTRSMHWRSASRSGT